MKRFFNLLSASTATVAVLIGLVGNTTSAFAGDANANITFSSTVAPTCFFGTPTGTTNLSLQTNSVSDLGTANQTIPLTCNNSATLSASAVTQGGAGATTLSTKEVALTVNGADFTSGNQVTGTTFDASGVATIGVTLTANNNTDRIAPGAYTFTTTLTATPQ